MSPMTDQTPQPLDYESRAQPTSIADGGMRMLSGAIVSVASAITFVGAASEEMLFLPAIFFLIAGVFYLVKGDRG